MDVEQQLPPARAFHGRTKWTEALAYAALAAVAVLLALLVRAQDAELPAMRALFWYAVVGAVAAALLALALALTRRLPTFEHVATDGRPALVVLALLGAQAATDALIWSLPPAVVAAWFAGLVVLALTGRRNREAFRVSEDRVVHESRRGRRSVALTEVERVWAGSGSDTLFVRSDDEVEVETQVPWLWGGRRVRRPDRVLAVDCSLMGHSATDLATWLQGRAGVGALGESVTQRRDRRS